MNHTHVRTFSLPLLGAALLACGGEPPAPRQAAAVPAGDVAVGESAAPVASAPALSQPVGPTAGLPPNELGQIMVLEYHRLGEPEGEWYRSEANFRSDLETLYAKGYRPITMRDVVAGNIDVPAGTTPVVFTFDDSSQGQFYYLSDGSIDPHSMLGIWEEFRAKNLGWANGATWCVLPGADYPSNFWGEKKSKEVPREEREAEIRSKVDFLVQRGHELCNHTMWHPRLDRQSDESVQDQIGSAIDSVKAYLPADYRITTFALPLGMWPKNRQLALQGTYRGGKTYENLAVLEVAGGPNPSPFDVEFDAHSIDRFIVAPNHLERQLAAWDKDPSTRFISDGDPATVTFPEALASRLDRARLNGKTVVGRPAGTASGGG